MPVATIIAIINGLVATAFNLYKVLKQVKGEEQIPTWNELLKENKELQEAIDAEMPNKIDG